jgi:hypothetical protein
MAVDQAPEPAITFAHLKLSFHTVGGGRSRSTSSKAPPILQKQ